MRHRLAAVGLAALLVAAFASSVAATTTQIPFSATSTFAGLANPGVEKDAGTTAHVYGIVIVNSQIGDNPMVTGTMTVTANFVFGGGLGQGNAMWGTERLEPTAYPGQWFDCTMSGGWDKDGVMQANDRCIGYGPDLAGWQFRSHISAESQVTGYLFNAGQ